MYVIKSIFSLALEIHTIIGPIKPRPAPYNLTLKQQALKSPEQGNTSTLNVLNPAPLTINLKP